MPSLLGQVSSLLGQVSVMSLSTKCQRCCFVHKIENDRRACTKYLVSGHLSSLWVSRVKSVPCLFSLGSKCKVFGVKCLVPSVKYVPKGQVSSFQFQGCLTIQSQTPKFQNDRIKCNNMPMVPILLY